MKSLSPFLRAWALAAVFLPMVAAQPAAPVNTALTVNAATGRVVGPVPLATFLSANGIFAGVPGTVTGFSAGDLAGLFTTTEATPTTTPALSFVLVPAAANLFWAGPGSGAAATPSYRAIVAADIPNIPLSKLLTDPLARANHTGTQAIGTVAGLQAALDAKETGITAGTTAQYFRGDKTFQTLDKAAVGLANAENTADAAKPISTATATALATKEGTITGSTAADYYRGDKIFVPLTKAAVGLPNADDTSDANKPISTATATALALKLPVYSGLTTGGVMQATSPTAVTSTLTPAGLTSIGANSLTAAATTNLTLAGGSGGASVTLGQGANGNVTLSPMGNGTVSAITGTQFRSARFATSDTGLSALELWNTSNGTPTTWRVGVSGSAGYAGGLANSFSITSGAGTAALNISNGLNLLIGGTTDVAGTGGLKVFGTTAATSTTSGAFQLGTNVGLSGNATGANYFGGTIKIIGPSAITRVRRDAAVIDFTNLAESAYAPGTFQGSTLSFLSDAGLGLSISATGVVAVPGTTVATSPTTGALTVAGGMGVVGAGYFGGPIVSTSATAASNLLSGALQVPNGGASIGGALYVGSTFNNYGQIRSDSPGGASASSLILTGGGSNIQIYHPLGLAPRIFNSAGNGITLSMNAAGASLGTVTVADGLKVLGTTAATTTTTGAFQVGTNVGLSGNAGGPSYFGGPIFTASNLRLTDTFALSWGSTQGTYINGRGDSTHAMSLVVNSVERIGINSTAVTIPVGDLVLATSRTPASATATGIAGTVVWDASFIYVCTATNTWKRTAIATW